MSDSNYKAEFPRRRSSLLEKFANSGIIIAELATAVTGSNGKLRGQLQNSHQDLKGEYYRKTTLRRRSSIFLNFPAVSINNDQIITQYGTRKENVTGKFFTGCVSTNSNDPAGTRIPENLGTVTFESCPNRRELASQIVESKYQPMSRIMKYFRKPNTCTVPDISSSSKQTRILPSFSGKTPDGQSRDSAKHHLGKTPSVNKASDWELPDFTRLPSIQRLPNTLGREESNVEGVCASEEFGHSFKPLPNMEVIGYFPDVESNPKPDGKLFEDLGLTRDGVPNAIMEDHYKPFPVRTEPSKYEKRKQYGKNLERNWFLQTLKSKDNKADDQFYLKRDMFYSPAPSDEDVGEYFEKQSERAVSPVPSLKENKNSLKQFGNSELFSSTDVLTGEHGEIDTNRSTPSEIEIVLIGDKLVERKIKHKMKKKRMRKQELYQKFLSSDDTSNPDTQKLAYLSDTQLRAMRLKLSKRKPQKIQGKRKFLQVANVVIAVIKFKKLLEKVRKRRKGSRKAVRKSKKVSWKPENENVYKIYERESIAVTLKRKFLEHVGFQLIKDVAALNLSADKKTKTEVTSLSAEKSSTFDENELKELLSRVSKDNKPHRLASRRNSDPGLSRPVFFPIEIVEKQKSRRRNRSKSRSKSRRRSSASCDRNSSGTRIRSASSSRSNVDTGATPTKSNPKVKVVMFDKREILNKRRPSLDEGDFCNKKAIELEVLLKDIDLPAKDIRIQIAKRKMRKNKRKKELQRMAVKEIDKLPTTQPDVLVAEAVSDQKELISNSEYQVSYQVPLSPIFSGAGVSWNLSKPRLSSKFTDADVEKELKRVTRLFMEMKDCHYIRWTPLNQAVISRLQGVHKQNGHLKVV